jgi:hypothetical protein
MVLNLRKRVWRGLDLKKRSHAPMKRLPLLALALLVSCARTTPFGAFNISANCARECVVAVWTQDATRQQRVLDVFFASGKLKVWHVGTISR